MFFIVRPRPRLEYLRRAWDPRFYSPSLFWAIPGSPKGSGASLHPKASPEKRPDFEVLIPSQTEGSRDGEGKEDLNNVLAQAKGD